MKDIYLDFYNPDIRILFLFALVAGIIYLSFRKNGKKKGTPLILFLRCFILLFITFLFLRPVLKWKKEIRYKPVIEIWVDNSLSIKKNNTFDADKLINQIDNTINRIKSSSVDMRTIKFDSRTEAIKKPSELDFNGPSSNFGNLINPDEPSIDAAILISDGQINSGEAAYDLAGRIDYPVFSIGIGDTATKTDARVVNINAPAKVKTGEKFDIKAEIELPQKSGDSKIQLLKNDQVIDSKVLTAGENEFLQQIEFTSQSEDIGENEYSIQIQSSNDENTANNQKTTLVNILPGEKNILIVCNAPSFETRGLMTIFNITDDFDASVAFFINGDLNIDLEEPYDLLILIGFPDRLTTETELQTIQGSFHHQTPVIVFLNEQTDTNKLNNLLKKEIITTTQVSKSTIIVKESGISHPVVREITSKLDWSQLPPIEYSFQEIQLLDSFQDLLTTTELNPKPVLTVNKQNATALFIGKEFWRWNMMTENRNYHQVFVNIIQYLLETGDNSKIQITSQKKLFLVGEAALFSGLVYDLKDDIIKNAEVRVTIFKDSTVVDSFYMNWQENSYKGHYTLKTAGDYQIEIEARQNGEIIDQKNLALKVNEQVLEFTQTGLNRETLSLIAKETGGEYINFDQVEEIISRIETKGNIIYQEQEFNFFIHELIFGLILFLLIFEWIIRKYYGYL